jgi:acyl-CoA dehydrogenase
MINSIYGLFLGPNLSWSLAGSFAAVLVLGFLGAPLIVWTVVAALALAGFQAPVPVLGLFGVLALVFNIRPFRRLLITSWVMKVMKNVMPKISETERVALEAGVVWIEKDLFSGKPNFRKLLKEPYPHLTKEEQDFLNGPVERLCAAVNDWRVWKERELPPEAWEILKKERFFGMIIPKEYGGLGFSALAHGEVIMKLATHSLPLCITAMVPNSLGPAELLIHYGTEEQKKRLLPRLATGEEIPCFALTEPEAGSDAGSIQAGGVLFRGEDGKLYIRLNWNKRWITLAAISTILGLAFRLYDPENLLGRGADVGITCALIPSNTKGVVLGRRHDPLGVPFYNCPTQGHDVVVSVDAIVGGVNGAGKGWKMLMECLAAGRGISLPGQSAGTAKLIARLASAHASIRKQFGVPIGQFEGIEEPLARIAAYNYLVEAMRRLTCGALDQGIKPPVVTAIAKYNSTELVRRIIIDGMDIQGGQGISRGPRNIMAHNHIASPIPITVEGANIMTRTLIIFGQGALRAHPYVYQEVRAVEQKDLKAFDRAFFGHIGHVAHNIFRSVLLSVTRGWLASAPVGGSVARYYRKLSWVSASFAIMADLAMGLLGGTLKFREKITGRFADILSWMYLGFSVLRRYEAEGRKKEDLPLVHYCMEYTFHQIQNAFDGIFENMGGPFGLGWFFSGPIRWWSHLNTLGDEAEDKISHKISVLIQKDGVQRDRLTEGIYYPTKEGEPLRRLEIAFKAVKAAEETEKKIRKAIKEKKLPKKRIAQLIDEALKLGIISQVEVANLKKSEELRKDAITVDDFSQEEYLGKSAAEVVAKIRSA